MKTTRIIFNAALIASAGLVAGTGCRVNPTSPDMENSSEGKACPPEAKIEDGEDNNNQVIVQDGRSGYIYTYADPEGTTAIFATSDTTAIGLMQAAYQSGVSIPTRLSIVGYDDIDLAPFTIPPLTTVSQTGVEMGRAATRLLLDIIDRDLDREDVDDVVLAPSLIVRESTAPPGG